MITPPHFLILGAQKAGTTWLTSVLASLSEFQKSKSKETRFLFANWRPEYDKMPAKDVLRLYQEEWDLPHTGITFEASPGYVAHPEVIQRLKNLGLAPKFVIILRDPVQRLVSVHHMWQRNLGLAEGFQQYWQGALDRVIELKNDMDGTGEWYQTIKSGSHKQMKGIAHGLFVFQLRAWISAFGAENFFITKTSKISDPNELMQLVRFCGGEKSSLSDLEAASKIEVGNRSSALPPPEVELAPFREFYAPYNKMLLDEFGIDLSN